MVIVSVSCDVRSVKGAKEGASLFGALGVAEVLVSEFKSVLGAMEDATLVGVLGVAEVLLFEFKSVLEVIEDASLVRSYSSGVKFNVSVWSDTVVKQCGHLKSSV